MSGERKRERQRGRETERERDFCFHSCYAARRSHAASQVENHHFKTRKGIKIPPPGPEIDLQMPPWETPWAPPGETRSRDRKGRGPATCGKAANVMPVHRIGPPGTPVLNGSRATPPLKLPPLIPFGDGLRNNSSSRRKRPMRASVIIQYYTVVLVQYYTDSIIHVCAMRCALCAVCCAVRT